MSAGVKRVAVHKGALTHAAVSRALPLERPYVLWDDAVVGFGLRISPGGTKSFFVQCRTEAGRRSDRNRKITLGRFPALTPGDARKRAQALIGAMRDGRDPAQERARARALPTLGEAVEEWLRVKEPEVTARSLTNYRHSIGAVIAGWHTRRLDRLTREELAARFAEVTSRHGAVTANRAILVLGALYRRACADHAQLRDPVAGWKRAGGRLHRTARRQIDPPAEVLPAWVRGIEHAVHRASVRDCFWFGMYTGMRLSEILWLRWERVDADARRLWVDKTKSGVALELPLTAQLEQIFARRREAATDEGDSAWVFSSPRDPARPLYTPAKHYATISHHGGRKFWFHALRNAFITVALQDLALPESLVKRLVNHAPAPDVTQDYATQWTLEQLRTPSQRIADRIDTLIAAGHETA